MGAWRGSEDIAILGTVDPDDNATGAFLTDYCDMNKFDRIMAILKLGVLTTTSTVDFKLQQATSSTGAGLKDITGAAVTQLTTASNDKQVVINLSSDQMDVTNSFDYVIGTMTVTTAAANADVTMLGLSARQGPASANDLASVSEIISVP